MCEIKTLRASEKVCSLVVDDMAVRDSISYSKAEDRIFGLETINQSQDKIGAKPVIANQLLCFVICIWIVNKIHNTRKLLFS
jgi:hypothetical protein